MNQEEVTNQIQQMVRFIQQEAREKAKEINIKAQEEFHIEKLRMVKAEKDKIETEFQQKKKQVEVQKKIAHSNDTRKSRLEVLKARDDALQKVIGDAKEELTALTDSDEYPALIEKILVEALQKLGEKNVTVYCTEKDKGVVEGAIGSATAAYPCDVTVSEEYLTESIGGVKVSGLGGKITLNNTLDARLLLAYEAMLPDIRSTLFGKKL